VWLAWERSRKEIRAEVGVNVDFYHLIIPLVKISILLNETGRKLSLWGLSTDEPALA
jgi:hypothetical protein